MANERKGWKNEPEGPWALKQLTTTFNDLTAFGDAKAFRGMTAFNEERRFESERLCVPERRQDPERFAVLKRCYPPERLPADATMRHGRLY